MRTLTEIVPARLRQQLAGVRTCWSDEAVRARAAKAYRRDAAERRVLNRRGLRPERDLAAIRARLDAAEGRPR